MTHLCPAMTSRNAESADLYLIDYLWSYNLKRAELLFDSPAERWKSNSTDWRFGDNCNMEWLMIYGCHTVDKNEFDRHQSVFQRLHLMCGAYGSMHDAWTVDEVGADTADRFRTLGCWCRIHGETGFPIGTSPIIPSWSLWRDTRLTTGAMSSARYCDRLRPRLGQRLHLQRHQTGGAVLDGGALVGRWSAWLMSTTPSPIIRQPTAALEGPCLSRLKTIEIR